MFCSKCGKEIEENVMEQWVAYDLQAGYQKKVFCSKECLKGWISGKQIGMWTSVIIGVILAIALLSEGAVALCLMLVPYMIRQTWRGLSDMFNSGAFGEFFSLFIVLIGSMTIIYPAYKLIQEIQQYKTLSEKYDLK